MPGTGRTVMLADQQDALLVAAARERGVQPEQLAAELLELELIALARWRPDMAGAVVIGGLFGPGADSEVDNE